MARVTIEDCLPYVDNRFALVLVAAKRARHLFNGARPAIISKNKPVVVALREIAEGKVLPSRDIRDLLRSKVKPKL